MSPRALSAACVLGWLLVATPAPAEEEALQPSFEFLRRQADLLFSYKKYDEAADTLEQACATVEGRVSLDCHTRLANAAEKAGRVALAIHAWELAAVLGDEAQREAQAELDRLYGTYGRMLIYAPEGRELPSRPLELKHTGFLIDPKQKETLAAFVERTARKGITETTVWLPFGTYTLGHHEFEVTAGEAAALVLDTSDVPFQAEALRSEGSGFVALGGPRELFVGAHLGVSILPLGEVGQHPLRLGGQVGIGVHAGPLRVEGRARVGAVRSVSFKERANTDRQFVGVELVGVFDVGVDVRLGGGAWLTPHIGVLGGLLGPATVGCEAVQTTTGHGWLGECALATGGAGGVVGLDVLLLPAGDTRRVGIRVGASFEAVGGSFLGLDGTPLVGLGTELVGLDRRHFFRIGGGLDVGLALRF